MSISMHSIAGGSRSMTAFGNALGRGPHARVNGARHPARINVLLVGQTAHGRKGQSRADVFAVLEHADPGWATERVRSGLASGEGLVAAVAGDEDGAPRDGRLFVIEEEFARVFSAKSREGSTLSEIIRTCYDRDNFAVMTRRHPLTASGVHVAILGHSTPEELRARATATDFSNGFLNRFLIVSVHRSRLLPHGI
jgi:hypothetical protein